MDVEPTALEADPPTRLLVVNDANLVVEGLAALFGPQPGIHIVGKLTGRLTPVDADVALVDAHGHPDAGIERVREVVALGTVRAVALYTWRLSPSRSVDAIEAGASGILSKSKTAAELARDVLRLHKGERVIHEFPEHVWAPTWTSSNDLDLTERETELLTLVARGLSNREIAAIMYLAESSVKTYLKRVYRKLGIHSRAEAVMRAVDFGLAGPWSISDQPAC